MSIESSPPSLSLQAKIFLLIVGMLLSAILLEIVVHLLESSPRTKRWSDRPYAFFLPAESHTLQEKDPSPKAAGSYRIIVVGDSFTFGPHLQLADTFPKRLEQMLNLQPEGPRVEVLNRGLCGASTTTEIELVRNALRESPDLLILEITLNDAEPHALSKEEHEAIFNPPWLRNPIFTTWRTLGFIASRIHNTQSIRRYIDYHSKFFKNPQTFEKFHSSIGRIAQQAKEANVPIMAIVFPLFDFPINDRYPFTETHEIIATSLKSHGVRTLDLRNAFEGIPPERLQVIPGSDNHPNEIAHRIAAEHLLAALINENEIPRELIPARIFRQRTGLKGPSVRPEKVFHGLARKAPQRAAEQEAEVDAEETPSL